MPLPTPPTRPTFTPNGVAFALIPLQMRLDLIAEILVPDLRDGADPYTDPPIAIDETRVVLVADRPFDGKNFADQITLRVRPLSGSNTVDPGPGRLGPRKTRTVAVDIITRLTVDDQSTDFAALTDLVFGHFQFEEQVSDCLDLHDLVYTDPNTLLTTPLTTMPTHETQADDPNRPQSGLGWVASTFYYECEYLPLYRVARV